MTMLNRSKNGNQQTGTITAEDLREYLPAKIDASQQAFAEVDDEQLEQITGGSFGKDFFRGVSDVTSFGIDEAYWHSKAGKQWLNS